MIRNILLNDRKITNDKRKINYLPTSHVCIYKIIVAKILLVLKIILHFPFKCPFEVFFSQEYKLIDWKIIFPLHKSDINENSSRDTARSGRGKRTNYTAACKTSLQKKSGIIKRCCSNRTKCIMVLYCVLRIK